MNWSNLSLATLETLGMTLLSTLMAYLVGIPLGIILSASGKTGIHPNRMCNLILGFLVNLLRSVPCLLLIIILLPLTRGIFVRGTGVWYTMLVPLFFASFPFVSRMVEQSLSEVPLSEIEAARSMGANDYQLIRKVLFPEAKPSLISGIAVSAISILGYTSFAYDFGAGGLIASAVSFYATNTGDYLAYPNIWIIILVVVLIVQLLQEIALYISRKSDKRRVH
jgi:D-methionine transport system permease protein